MSRITIHLFPLYRKDSGSKTFFISRHATIVVSTIHEDTSRYIFGSIRMYIPLKDPRAILTEKYRKKDVVAIRNFHDVSEMLVQEAIEAGNSYAGVYAHRNRELQDLVISMKKMDAPKEFILLWNYWKEGLTPHAHICAKLEYYVDEIVVHE